LAGNLSNKIPARRVGGVRAGDPGNQGVQIVIVLIPLPGGAVRRTLRYQPGIVLAGILQRVLIGELQVEHSRLAVEDLVRDHRAKPCMASIPLHSEAVEMAYGLFTSFGFQRPLRNHHCRRAAGLRCQRNRDFRDFFQSLSAIFRLRHKR
jgi:hypothetical protein